MAKPEPNGDSWNSSGSYHPRSRSTLAQTKEGVESTASLRIHDAGGVTISAIDSGAKWPGLLQNWHPELRE